MTSTVKEYPPCLDLILPWMAMAETGKYCSSDNDFNNLGQIIKFGGIVMKTNHN